MIDQPDYIITRFVFSNMLNGDVLRLNGTPVRLSDELRSAQAVQMILFCPNPECCKRHIDVGEFATPTPAYCGFVWRPAIVPTVGVQFLPGFKDGGP